MFLVFVTMSKEGGENNSFEKRLERKEIYSKRIQQIHRICQKYILSAAEEENIRKSTYRILQQSDSTALIAIPPLSEKVWFIANLMKNFLQVTFLLEFHHVSWKVLLAVLLDSQSGFIFMEQNIFWVEQLGSSRGLWSPHSQPCLQTQRGFVITRSVWQVCRELCICPPSFWAPGLRLQVIYLIDYLFIYYSLSIYLQGQVWACNRNWDEGALVQTLLCKNPGSLQSSAQWEEAPEAAAEFPSVCLLSPEHLSVGLWLPLAALLASLSVLS